MARKDDRDDFILTGDPYFDLGNAIVAQAYKDYINFEFAGYSVVKTINGNIIDSENNMQATTVNQGEIEDFFHSELYSLITDIDGDAIIDMARREIDLIKKAFREGWVWEQFTSYNCDEAYSVNKTEYKLMHNNARQKRGIELLVRKYESQIRDPEFKNKEHLYRVCKKVLPTNPLWRNATYILMGDKMNFYLWDEKKNDYYKVFNGNRVLDRKSFYKKSKYYKNLKKEAK